MDEISSKSDNSLAPSAPIFTPIEVVSPHPEPVIDHKPSVSLKNSIGREIRAEFSARKPLYISDWTDGYKEWPIVLSSVFFCFFAQLTPAITFASMLDSGVGGQLGVIEVLFTMAICGCLYAIFSGQPLVLTGVTGPISIFTITVYGVSQAAGLDFLPFMCWISFWSALMHITFAVLNACSSVRFVTSFTCEIFGILIALVYIITGTKELVHAFRDYSLAGGFFAILIAFLTLFLARCFAKAKEWKILNCAIRAFLSDYAIPLSVFLATAVSFSTSSSSSSSSDILARLFSSSSSFHPSNGRSSWIVPFWTLSTNGIFLAIIPAFILTILIYFDHNVSSLLSQSPNSSLLKKPAAYNLDFLVIGLLMIPTGLLGLPWCHGLIPQAPLHVRSLTSYDKKNTSIPIKICENRVSAFGCSLLIGIMLSPPFLYLLGLIPKAALAGLFFFMALESFIGNQFAERIQRLFILDCDTDVGEDSVTPEEGTAVASDDAIELQVGDPTQQEEEKPPAAVYEPTSKRINLFTLVQLMCLAIVFFITEFDLFFASSSIPVGILFPIFILLLIPFRISVVTKWFSKEELLVLDKSDF